MTLTDAGPLIALVNRNDPHHAGCVAVLASLPAAPFVTTWPCFTEAMYLLLRAGGYLAQRDLWRMTLDGRLVLHDLNDQEIVRAAELMHKYRDRPMDLADATLIAVAESMHLREILSIDQDFHLYRLADGSVLRLIPERIV